MQSIGEIVKDSMGGLFTPISKTVKTCEKHGVEYEEIVYPRHTVGCPKCREELEVARKAEEMTQREEAYKAHKQAQIEKRIGNSRIPKRFVDKTVGGYRVDAGNEQQQYIVDRIKTYAHEFSGGSHSGRNLALLGNAGTGKTHLACAVGRHVIQNCNGLARFASVSEINRLVREAKSFDSEISETEVIQSLGGYDLLIIDEVGVQSGTEAESRALFDVFNERYQNCKPTILISNLSPAGFREAVGDRIADRVKEDGGEVLMFNWGSARG